MYCPDTLQRMNDAAVDKARSRVEEEQVTCEYCGERPATQVIPVYNPADSVRGIDGAYAVYELCDECVDDGAHLEENFYCSECGELFIEHHSWDYLAVIRDGEMLCHKCAAETLEGVPLWELLEELDSGNHGIFSRLNDLPGKEAFWTGEFSGWSDFPGFTRLVDVAQAIEEAAGEHGLNQGDVVYPVITGTQQFSVDLAVYF